MIWIIQCLCGPNRHAIYAIAYDAKEMPHDLAMADIQQSVNTQITKGQWNPWCGICGSRDWTYEQRLTKYKTMEEAKTEMSKLELENLVSRLLIDSRKAEKN